MPLLTMSFVCFIHFKEKAIMERNKFIVPKASLGLLRYELSKEEPVNPKVTTQFEFQGYSISIVTDTDNKGLVDADNTHIVITDGKGVDISDKVAKKLGRNYLRTPDCLYQFMFRVSAHKENFSS